jgi:hypothetical protein
VLSLVKLRLDGQAVCMVTVFLSSVCTVPILKHNVGPSRVHALPLGVAAEQSVHYIWYYFSFFFLCHILFSQNGMS